MNKIVYVNTVLNLNSIKTEERVYPVLILLDPFCQQCLRVLYWKFPLWVYIQMSQDRITSDV